MSDRLPTFSPEQFRKLSWVALFFLTVVVLTGAAVRLTGSGLGCPDWPQCHGQAVPPLGFNTFVEYGNRVFSACIGVISLFVWFAAWRRRPYRRDLFLVSGFLPLGCLAQGVLGGFTVKHHLAPGFVMAHFCLSMLILIAAVWLVWRARYDDDAERPRSEDAWTVWLVRFTAALGGIVIFAGTLATAAGPHPGDNDGELVHRLDFKGAETLVWLIHRHGVAATTLGLCVILAWFMARRRTTNAQLVEALTLAGILMAAQGLVGSVQYALKLPADFVWVHVTLATITWIALLWTVGAAGRVGTPTNRSDDGPDGGNGHGMIGAESIAAPVPAAARR
ncbi:COX15/CtaA family protein [Conexibacter sp. JD483]|uniref:COX15/CtaA family protein n=1 Tax=unclassified Conexibacter TaxID=2627773 RepID=UPI00271CC123|nr:MULTISPECIES: COX15/CtaA family protein [unclassified Conexibacter]MDO8184081.1 COX15/CtaA family protein [Conexibacter sp. CPCC 205706]MDO8197073.1 COX15/CtaA family protein [Conexibacter sp. CPCC 205762]MDR9371112.1 COX15/CtaA family protein [Conexibacter sp. JD483]